MKKLSDEAAAGIFAAVWVAFMYLALIIELTGSMVGWYIFLLDSAVQITILIYDAKVSRLEKQLKTSRKNLANMSAEYTEYVRSHTKTEQKQPSKVIDIGKLIKERRAKHGSRKAV
jgi:hypothetical protein